MTASQAQARSQSRESPPVGQRVHGGAAPLDTPSRRCLQPVREPIDSIEEFFLRGDHELRCRRRRRRAEIRDEIRDGEVHLVTHCGNHRNGARDDRARDPLFVEGPEVFGRSAASAE